MEYRRHTGSWSSWFDISGTTTNAYHFLSTTRTTPIEVRFKASGNMPASLAWTHTIQALNPAPTGLSIEWIDGSPFLTGLVANRYYATAANSAFSPFTELPPGTSRQLNLNVGNILFVRTALNSTSPSSAHVALTVPPVPVDVTAKIIDLEFDNGMYSLNEVQFQGGANQAVLVRLNRHSANGTLISEGTRRAVTIGSTGTLNYTNIDASVKDFAPGEYIEIMVFNSGANQLLLRQRIRPVLF
jgi:hypothetical protein